MRTKRVRDCRRDPCSGSHLRDNTPPEIKPYDIGAAIDWMVRPPGFAPVRWDVVSKAMRVIEEAFTNNETGANEVP